MWVCTVCPDLSVRKLKVFTVVKPVLSDHIKQDKYLAFQTGGCLLLHELSALLSFTCLWRFPCHLNGWFNCIRHFAFRDQILPKTQKKLGLLDVWKYQLAMVGTVKPLLSDYIKQDIYFAFQTVGCLLLHERSALLSFSNKQLPVYSNCHVT